ncbi:MAG: alpha-ketoacid dehydrogenase subunit beta [Alcanivorax sp.]|nr:alpha-ketoacid dehydrogenase subunit beta [Alcanivorax sp.]
MAQTVDEEIAAAEVFAEAGHEEAVASITEHVYRPAEPHLPPPKAPPQTGEITYRDACRLALQEALQNDERVFLMGEDVGRYGGCYAVSRGLLEQFGEQRVRDTPLSENGFTGAGIGAALGGRRPVVEIMTVNFSLLALDQIVNTAASLLHMSGGQFNVPLVIRIATGASRQLGAQHSHSLENWFAHVPGLKVLAPATLEDARYMLWAALQDPNPVVIFEHVQLYNRQGTLQPRADGVDLVRAAIRRPGRDLSLITYGGNLHKALEAAEQLATEGIEAEVIDLRVLRPLDEDTLFESLSRTHRAVIVDEGWKSGSLAGEISARLADQAFWQLDAPLCRVCSLEVPMPYAAHLEQAVLPQVETIVAACRGVMEAQA